MRLEDLVGTPTAPADPAAIPAAAENLLAEAQASSACVQPVIALNELLDPDAPQPWSAATRRYRDDIAALLAALAGRASVHLLVPGSPASSGIFSIRGSEAWWVAVAQSATIVPEVYFDAKAISRAGSDLAASRYVRLRFRQALAVFMAAGVPAGRLGLMLGFQSGGGQGGREALAPAQRWFEVVKLQALAARDVAADTGISTVWSWGWGTFATPGSADADKATAACVYLWTRDPNLCIDAPDRSGPAFNADLGAGSLALPPGTACSWEGGGVGIADVEALAGAAGSRGDAARLLAGRVLARGAGTVGLTQQLRLERGVVAARFRGSRSAYLASLAPLRLSAVAARQLLADDRRLDLLGAALAPDGPSARQTAGWIARHAGEPTRRVHADRPVTWLAGRTAGIVLRGSAPAALFGARVGETVVVASAQGPLRVRVLSQTRPLRSRTSVTARPVVAALLQLGAQALAARAWIDRAITAARSSMRCARDEFADVPAATVPARPQLDTFAIR